MKGRTVCNRKKYGGRGGGMRGSEHEVLGRVVPAVNSNTTVACDLSVTVSHGNVRAYTNSSE